MPTLTQKNSPYYHWEFLQVDTGNRLRIVPERGGLITEWLCNGREILYFDHERFQQKGKSVRGGIPILFPICGDLPRGVLPLAKGDFKINQHGFARDSIWKIKAFNDQSGFCLSMQDSERTRSIYQYEFDIDMEVRLIKNFLDLKIIITNSGKDPMPFSFGLHPYFKVKDITQTKIEGLSPTSINQLNMLEVETDQQLACLSKGVDFMNSTSEIITLVDLLGGNRLHMKHHSPMDLTVVWTDPPRPMVCIEPWTSPRGSLISGERKLLLKPQATQELQCRFISD